MSALKVLTVGVYFVIGLRAAGLPAPDSQANGGHSATCANQQSADAAFRQRAYTTAIQLYGECVTTSGDPEARVNALAAYGIALHQAGRDSEARPALERALADWPHVDRFVAVTSRSAVSGVLAATYRGLGDYQSAERVLRNEMKDESASAGNRSSVMVNLADLLREEARETEASGILTQASRLPGLARPQRLGILVEAAELAREMRLWNESVTLWNEVMEIAQNEHSLRLEEVATGGLGETWFAAGDLARAEPLIRRSLGLIRGDAETRPSQLGTALALMARLYLAENKLAMAEEALDEAIAKDGASLGPSHPQIAVLLELSALTKSRRDEAQAARDDLERARTIMSSHFGARSTAVAGVLATLGDVEMQANRPEAAVVEYGMAVTMLRETGADTLQFCSGVVARYARALKATHRGDEAKDVLRSLAAARKPGLAVVPGAASFHEK